MSKENRARLCDFLEEEMKRWHGMELSVQRLSDGVLQVRVKENGGIRYYMVKVSEAVG